MIAALAFFVGLAAGAIIGFILCVRYKRTEYEQLENDVKAVEFAKTNMDQAAANLNRQAEKVEEDRLVAKWAVNANRPRLHGLN